RFSFEDQRHAIDGESAKALSGAAGKANGDVWCGGMQTVMQSDLAGYLRAHGAIRRGDLLVDADRSSLANCSTELSEDFIVDRFPAVRDGDRFAPDILGCRFGKE